MYEKSAVGLPKEHCGRPKTDKERMSMCIAESERLVYRRITKADFDELKIMLTDPKVMYAWEHTFSDAQIWEWIELQERYYRQDGVGYFAAVDRSGKEVVGQMGLHRFLYKNNVEFEVGYMLKYQYFKQGYAVEGVNAMVHHAFSKRNLSAVYARIRSDNEASLRVAEKAGFVKIGEINKYYNGKDMPHSLYRRKKEASTMKKVAFICVHNSCRSQIAEALGKHLAADIFESYSAGTETKEQINQDAVRLMKQIYGIDMEAEGQYSKLLSELPEVDVAISMGCNVECPFIGRAFDDNWGLEDPTGKSDEVFKTVIGEIERKILALKREFVP